MTRFLTLLIATVWLALPLRAATDVVEVTSDGGITAWLVEEHSIPMLSMSISFEGGPVLDPEDKMGASNLMMGLIEEGAGKYDSFSFAARAQELAARFSYDAARASVSISANMLTEERDESVALLALAINDPLFKPQAVERVRKQVLAGLREDETNPRRIAARAFAKSAYGDHPGARPTEGTLETVADLTRDDILAAHRRDFVRDRLTVGVVGDITPEELGPILDRLFGGLPESGPPLPPEAEIHDAKETVVIPFDTPQSVARFGHVGIDRQDPDFLAAYVVNHILGGGGQSRLNEEVRVKRGLTYGIQTVLLSDPLGSLYLGVFASANEKMGEAVDIVRQQWAKMAENGVTAEELENAKKYLTGAYPLRFTSNGGIASMLVGMQIAGLSTDYVKKRNDMVNALTLEEVNRVARDLLKPDQLRVVVVGQPEGLESSTN